MFRINGHQVTDGEFTKIILDKWGRIVDASFPSTLDGYNILDAVKNAKNTPQITADTLLNRPSPGILGQLFFDTQNMHIWQDDGTQWKQIDWIQDGGFF